MQQRTVLICTVGTSLFYGNLRHLSEANTRPQPDNWQELKQRYNEQNWTALAKELVKLPADMMTCGAEINTIHQAIKHQLVDLKTLIFLVSDTEDGRNVGAVLKSYYNNRKDLNLQEVQVVVIDDLQDQKPNLFKTRGLRNLVRAFGDVIHKRFSADQVAIDATGGYKAQIALAVLVGQSLNIPVYYKHERFAEIIDFPPLPIALDFDLLGDHSDILVHFEKGGVQDESIFNGLPSKLQVFFTGVEIDDQLIYELNAIGQLYLTTYRLRHPYIPALVALSDNERKSPTFGTHHRLLDFEQYVNKVWEENKWIRTCKGRDFKGQKGIKGKGFKVIHDPGQNKDILMGTYKSELGRKFEVVLSDMSRESLNWAADQLNRKYQ